MLYETLTDLLNNDPAAYEYFYALPAEIIPPIIENE